MNRSPVELKTLLEGIAGVRQKGNRGPCETLCNRGIWLRPRNPHDVTLAGAQNLNSVDVEGLSDLSAEIVKDSRGRWERLEVGNVSGQGVGQTAGFCAGSAAAGADSLAWRVRWRAESRRRAPACVIAIRV